jgi:DNA polymerase-3 subunit delta'
MGFADILGQEKSVAILRGALAANRLHHAYLFTGPDGVGKRTTAIMMAMALHCAEKNGDACGRCVECARIKARNHPDVREIEPLPGKKEILIKQVREMEKELRYRSFTGGRKIAILDPASLLNPFSQNALLKTLEEPPPESLLILIAPNAGALLPTLRSRCLRVNFGPIPREVLARFLAAKKGRAAEEAELLAALSMGSLGVALAMDGKVWAGARREWGRGLAALTDGDYRAAMELADGLASSRDDSLNFLNWFQSWCRDLLAHGLQLNDIVNLDMLPELQTQLREPGFERVLSAATRASEAAALIQRNLNRRMVLEQLLFRVVESR